MLVISREIISLIQGMFFFIKTETDQYAAALTKAGCNLHALRYLKRWK